MASDLIERDLYNGLFPTVHNPIARGSSPRYVVMVDGQKTKPKGVTTILGATLAKDFTVWVLDCMGEYLEDKLPVITQEDIDEAKKESTRRRDSGANDGTLAHAMAEHHLKGTEYTGATTPEALKAFGAFKAWFEKTKPEVINVEDILYSQEFGYCGTYDCMLKIEGKVYLCDLKTTNTSRKAPKGIYAEHFVQLGAYAQAYEEQRAYEEENGGTKLLSIDGLMVISAKKNGKLDIVTNKDLGVTVEDCRQMFKKVINLYTFQNYLTKELGGK